MEAADKVLLQRYKEIITKAICHYVALLDFIPKSVFKILASHIDLNCIDDNSLLKNDRLKDIIDWDKLDKRKLIRLIIRDKFVIERLDMNKHNFTFTDLIPIFYKYPDLIEYFELDYNDLNSVEAIKMLEINPVFIEKIDLLKYEYTNKQLTEIVKKFYNNPEIIEQLNMNSFDHYSTRTLLIKTGTKYLNNINIEKLKSLDWLGILQFRPELSEYCDLSMFKKGDYFELTQLVKIFPDLYYLIEENKDKINALGWENLLIFDSNQYSRMCNFEILSKKNWEKIIKVRPELSGLKNQYII
jgi:hypothetical protein